MTSPLPIPAPNYGIDADRFLARDSLLTALRRRIDGRYAVDEFGGDPHLMDLFSPLTRTIRVRAENGDVLPRSGPALLVANRGIGVVEPLVLGEAVRKASGRRLRVVGAPEIPVLGPAIRKLGAIGYRPDDVAAMLRAGHLVAAPLGPTWMRAGAGEPPRELLVATLGFPVIPIAIRPGGPASLPLRPWRVIVGAPLLPPAGTDDEDQLAAAELAEQVRAAVDALLQETR
jgi:1-acyl-sn-glycerol-3-phosphate acyltransferase